MAARARDLTGSMPSRGRISPVLPLLCALASAGIPSGAAASPLLELVGGLGGGGFNARVSGVGAEVAYFNPALLASQIESLDVYLFGLGNTLAIDVQDRPASADVADSIYGAWLSDGMGGVTPLPNPPLATSDLAERQANNGVTGFQSYLGFGVVKHIIRDRLVFGFYGTIPAGELQGHNVFYADEREQYFSNSLRFELYDDRLTLNTFSFALGSRVNDMLSLGVGFVAAIDTNATTPVYVPDGADLGNVYLDQRLSVESNLAPHFGASLALRRGLRVTAAVHTPAEISVKGSNDIRLPNGNIAQQAFSFTHGYEPLTIALGASVDAWACEDRRLVLAANATWRGWSSYLDRHSNEPLDPWQDTVSASMGGRYTMGETEVFFDATLVPSPVPDQTGRTNYVDNTRLGFSGGIRADTRVLGSNVSGGFFIQGHRLLARSVTKDAAAEHPVIDEFPDNAVDPLVDANQPLPEAQGLQTNNPGFPGYESRGFIIAAGVDVRLAF